MKNVQLYNVISKLLKTIIEEEFIGYDPFDGLNSSVADITDNRFIKLVLIQLFKRSPVNLRRFFKIRKGYNPKGLSLILSGNCLLYKYFESRKYLENAKNIAGLLVNLKSPDKPYSCWGYNFPWMARAFYVSRYKPNMIVSSFVAQSFLDLYDFDENPKWLKVARDVISFIQRELIIISSDEEICFGYIPGENVIVHNANLMGARLFARLASKTEDDDLKEIAIRSVNYTVNHQYNDGSWVYGELDHHQWIDNFHTGFNLVAIHAVQKYLNIDNWQKSIESGLKYHLNHHFINDMTPKYFDTALYPIDIHNYAQGIDTFLTFGLKKEAKLLLENCFENFWDKEKHYFYYQKTKYYTNKINYIRWSQAWMFYALAKYLINTDE